MSRPLAILAALSLTVTNLGAIEIIAHRGASEDAPENTMASFREGWKQQADADELDIHLSKDGEVIVMHDASTKRTAGIDQPIATQTLEELKALDAGKWKSPQWTGEKIPTLAEVLATIPDNRRLFIEIKCGPEVLPKLTEVMRASGKKAEQLVIIGFSYATMKKAKELYPQQPVYWLASPPSEKSKEKTPTIEELIAMSKDAKLDGLDLSSKFTFDAGEVAKAKAAGLKMYAWTVNDAATAKALVALGYDGITTNRPAWLREQLK